MDTSAKAEVAQASDVSDFVSDEDIVDPPLLPDVSRGSNGYGSIPVLVELLRPIPHLTSE
jgi:hypothetical protein